MRLIWTPKADNLRLKAFTSAGSDFDRILTIMDRMSVDSEGNMSCRYEEGPVGFLPLTVVDLCCIPAAVTMIVMATVMFS